MATSLLELNRLLPVTPTAAEVDKEEVVTTAGMEEASLAAAVEGVVAKDPEVVVAVRSNLLQRSEVRKFVRHMEGWRETRKPNA